MLQEKILNLISEQIDFANDELEALVEAQNAAFVQVVKAANDYETAVQITYPDDPEALQSAMGLAEGIVDFANELGKAFPALSAAQAQKFKDLFAQVFTQPGAIEPAGERLFNATVESLAAIRALVDYVNANIQE